MNRRELINKAIFGAAACLVPTGIAGQVTKTIPIKEFIPPYFGMVYKDNGKRISAVVGKGPANVYYDPMIKRLRAEVEANKFIFDFRNIRFVWGETFKDWSDKSA